jgi:hypothetical protein
VAAGLQPSAGEISPTGVPAAAKLKGKQLLSPLGLIQVLAERNGGGARSLGFGESGPHRHELSHSLRRSVIDRSQFVTTGGLA